MWLMAYGDFKDLSRRTASEKVLRNKAFSIAKNQKCDGYQSGLASMVYTFFYEKSSGGAINSLSNQQLANELHKAIIKKITKWIVYSLLKDNIWYADPLDMQLIGKFNKVIRFSL